jgi:hypothetical protein
VYQINYSSRPFFRAQIKPELKFTRHFKWFFSVNLGGDNGIFLAIYTSRFRQSRVEEIKNPSNLPLQRETFYTPLLKRGEGGIFGKT